MRRRDPAAAARPEIWLPPRVDLKSQLSHRPTRNRVGRLFQLRASARSLRLRRPLVAAAAEEEAREEAARLPVAQARLPARRFRPPVASSLWTVPTRWNRRRRWSRGRG